MNKRPSLLLLLLAVDPPGAVVPQPDPGDGDGGGGGGGGGLQLVLLLLPLLVLLLVLLLALDAVAAIIGVGVGVGVRVGGSAGVATLAPQLLVGLHAALSHISTELEVIYPIIGVQSDVQAIRGSRVKKKRKNFVKK